jgi:ParB-like chromosome segregation protein Spo0J
MDIEITYLPLDDLTPADYNPRVDLKDGDTEFEKLKKSIKKFGFIDPIIYNTRTNRIVGGHQRWKAAKSLGLEKVPVVHVDLPEEQEKVLNIGLNKISGDFDEEKLGQLLADLEMGEIGTELMELTGFDDYEIDALITAVEMRNENAMSDLDDFLNDDEDDSDDDEDESDPMDDGFDVPDGFVKYQIACTTSEREIIVKAVKKMKEQGGCETSNEALAEICQIYLGSDMNE